MQMKAENLFFDYSTPKTLRIKISGNWQIADGLPVENDFSRRLSPQADIKQITFDASGLGNWDSALVAFLFQLISSCAAKHIQVNQDGLPAGVRKLLALALAGHEKVSPPKAMPDPFLAMLGDRVIKAGVSLRELLDFLGQITVSFGRLITGKAYFRGDDFLAIAQKCGAGALGLVCLISLLIGIVLAFIGALQLKIFGAQIFIADIVGIAMVRVMGAVMTGVLISGRTGASFAAELGTMQVNDEIDALKTMGVSPVEFLVMPRILALVVMMPLLTLYANLMGILGGLFVSAGVLGINPVEYLHHTYDAVKLNYLWVGLIHSLVFGVIIAVCGCLRGINCGRSASAVGEAATSAVVSAITCIVIATAIITFVCQVLGV